MAEVLVATSKCTRFAITQLDLIQSKGPRVNMLVTLPACAGKTETLGRVGSSSDLQPTPGFAPTPAAPDSLSTNPHASENGGVSVSGWDDIDAGQTAE